MAVQLGKTVVTPALPVDFEPGERPVISSSRRVANCQLNSDDGITLLSSYGTVAG
mgnify:FL=1